MSGLTHWQMMNGLKLRKETHRIQRNAFFSSLTLHWLIFSVSRIKLKCSSYSLVEIFYILLFMNVFWPGVLFDPICLSIKITIFAGSAKSNIRRLIAFQITKGYFLSAQHVYRNLYYSKYFTKRKGHRTEQRPTSSPTDFFGDSALIT